MDARFRWLVYVALCAAFTPEPARGVDLLLNDGAQYSKNSTVSWAIGGLPGASPAFMCLSTTANCLKPVAFSSRGAVSLSSTNPNIVRLWLGQTAADLAGTPDAVASIIYDKDRPRPASVVASACNGGSVVSWLPFFDRDSGVSSYRLHVGSANSSLSCGGGGIASVTRSRVVSGLQNGVKYKVLVCAVDGAGNSTTSGGTALVTPRSGVACPSAETLDNISFALPSGGSSSRLIILGEHAVRDNGTGLVWQRHMSKRMFTWEGSIRYCDSLTNTYGSDWRVPNRTELLSLVDEAASPVVVSQNRLGPTPAAALWTQSPAHGLDGAWAVSFSDGAVVPQDILMSAPVRCVHGAPPSASQGRFSSSNGIVSDLTGGRMWQAQPPPLPFSHADAVKYCDSLSLGGYSDWRLPTMQESVSLLTSPRSGVYLPGAFGSFSGAGEFWASARSSSGPQWMVGLQSGSSGRVSPTGVRLRVRCVR